MNLGGLFVYLWNKTTSLILPSWQYSPPQLSSHIPGFLIPSLPVQQVNHYLVGLDKQVRLIPYYGGTFRLSVDAKVEEVEKMKNDEWRDKK
jgi:hypothetical protein